MKNQSNLMLAAALDNEDALYWEQDTEKPPSPKRKQPQVEEESLDNLVSMVKMAMSAKKHKSILKGSPATSCPITQSLFQSDSQMVTLQVTTISQLTKIVSAVQQENKIILACFDQLAAWTAALASSQN